MSWKDQLRADPMPWLLEAVDPGVRYLALRDLLELPADDRQLRRARRVAHKEGPIAQVLDQMDAEGYWVRPGPGYNPKYRSTVWAIILLAQLGAQAGEDERIGRACKYLLDHGLCEGGQFTTISSGTPSGAVDCLQGNLCWSLLEMGYDDPRLASAYEWMARTVTGQGIAPVDDKDAPVRYYAYKCGPTFACGPNGNLPCAWGAVKVMLAFGKWPPERRTGLIKRAVKNGIDFLFSTDPATARYPTRTAGKPSRDWWKFGFPVFYITDLLQLAEALAVLGYGNDPRLAGVLEIIRAKQDEQGRWPLEFDYTGKTWIDFGGKKQPNKWVTWRALRVLKATA